jgi:hypothetical protein
MTKSKVAAIVATVAFVAALAAATGSASARPWTRHGVRVNQPRLYANRVYPGRIRYYSVCGYGDCLCLRKRALATGSQVWWDRYDACTG